MTEIRDPGATTPPRKPEQVLPKAPEKAPVVPPAVTRTIPQKDASTISASVNAHNELKTERKEFPAFQEDPPAKPEQKQNWTVVVNLEANHPQWDAGAHAKAEQLKELTAKTKDTGVTIVVQELVKNKETNQEELKRYVLKDGEQKDVTTTSPKPDGAAKDLGDVVKYAKDNFPSEKLAVISQSHGIGPGGIYGDHETAGGHTKKVDAKDAATPLADVKQSLEKALGDTKIDMLNFDACSMGNLEVLQSLAPLTKNVVASAELEHVIPDVRDDDGKPKLEDGQHVKNVLESLLKDPTMDAAKLSETAVDEATKHRDQQLMPSEPPEPLDPSATYMPMPKELDDKDKPASGTDTVAAWDMSKFPAYQQALGTLGNVLADRVQQDPAARKALEEIAAKTPAYNDRKEADMANQQRDAGKYLDGLDQAIRDKTLADPDHAIERAVKEAREAQQAMTRKYEGSDKGGYHDMSGLGLFLPDAKFNDPAAAAVADSPFTKLKAVVETKDTDLKRKAEAVSALAANLDSTLNFPQEGPRNTVPDVQPLIELATKARVKAAQGDAAGLEDVYQQMQTALSKLSAPERGLTKQVEAMLEKSYRKDAERTRRDAHLNAPDGWKRFTDLLAVPKA